MNVENIVYKAFASSGFDAELLKESDIALNEIDSLELFEIAEEIEDYYDIALNNDSILECKKVSDLINLVKKVSGRE